MLRDARRTGLVPIEAFSGSGKLHVANFARCNLCDADARLDAAAIHRVRSRRFAKRDRRVTGTSAVLDFAALFLPH